MKKYVQMFRSITENLSEKFGSKIALTDDFSSLTFNDLNKKCCSLAETLKRKDIKKGDLVLLQLPNCNDFIISLFALFRIGAVPVLLHNKYSFSEIKPIIKLCKPKIWIKTEELSLNETGKYDFKKVINKKQLDIWQNTEYKDSSNVNNISGSLNDTAFIILSSGTTGIPKCIPKTYRELISLFSYFIKSMAFNTNTSIMITGPLSHIFSLNLLIGTILSGGCAFMTEFLSPIDIIQTVKENKVNTLGMVPVMLRMCINFLEQANEKCVLSKGLIIGGSKSSKSDFEKAMNLFSCPVTNLYGSGEGVFSYAVYRDADNLLNIYEGKPISKLDQIKILDDAEQGELLVKGSYVFKGYYGMKDENNKYFTRDGFYRTGDIAQIDRSGNILIYGRNSELINRCGEKIVPSELEEMLLQIENVAECAVCGLKDNFLGEKIVAFIYLKNKSKKFSLSEIKSYMLDLGMADYKLPDELVLLKNFPKTSSGKIQKNKLIEQYVDGKIDYA